MERYVWVKNARARFADVLNTAAYGSERVVILRRGEELGAFIGPADLEFLRRHKPLSRYPEPRPPPMPPDPAEQDLKWREERLAFHQRIAQQRGASAVELEALAEQQADLQRLRAYYGPSPPGEKAN